MIADMWRCMPGLLHFFVYVCACMCKHSTVIHLHVVTFLTPHFHKLFKAFSLVLLYSFIEHIWDLYKPHVLREPMLHIFHFECAC